MTGIKPPAPPLPTNPSSKSTTPVATLAPPGAMMGIHVTITVANVSLDLLRPASATDEAGSELASAFSLQITDLRADIDILALMKADVKLRSFDIIDTRSVSRDYVFRKVFCPVVDMESTVADWRASAAEADQQHRGSVGSRYYSARRGSSGASATATTPTSPAGVIISERSMAVSTGKRSKSKKRREEKESSGNSAVGGGGDMPGVGEKEGEGGNGTVRRSLKAQFTDGTDDHGNNNDNTEGQKNMTVDVATTKQQPPRDIPRVISRLRGVGDRPVPSPTDPPLPPDLLHVTYNQVSPSISFINVIALNVTTFVSIDTILDLTWVALANFFAVLDLIAAPPILTHDALWPYSIVPEEEQEQGGGVAESGGKGSDLSDTKGQEKGEGKTQETVTTKQQQHQRQQEENNEKDALKRLIEKGVAAAMTNSAPPPPAHTAHKSIYSPLPSTTTTSPAGKMPLASSSSSPSSSRPPPSMVIPPPPPLTSSTSASTAAGAKVPTNSKPSTTPVPPSSSSSDAGGDDTDLHIHIPARPSTTMNLVVKVANPRLILLDDPTTDESRAIVSSCGIEVHYSREVRQLAGIYLPTGLPNRELRESLHVSVKDHKVFVLRSMLNWSPQPILEPLGMDYNLRRRSVNGVAVASNMSMDVDNINAR